MRIAEINAVNFGSTGNIMRDVAERAIAAGNEAICLVPSPCVPRSSIERIFGGLFFRRISLRLAHLTGLHNFLYVVETLDLIRKLNKFHPDIIHLHNLHGDYLNHGILFNYIKRNKVKVIWTLHDCWSFTGHCPHFDLIGCKSWTYKCGNCPQYTHYPYCRVDDSARMFNLKKKWYSQIDDMTLIAPSKWMEDLLKKSILSKFPVSQIYSGIDLNVFQPTPSDFIEKYDIKSKHIVLGVAFDWGVRKGLDVFIELSKRLSSDYQIVLVGVNEEIRGNLPTNIISITRTSNQKELAEIYTASDVFVNPTREELFGLVNVESLACGTPVITFRTGGSPESIDETCGIVVEKNDIDSLEESVKYICVSAPFTQQNCRKRAELFDKNDKFQEYIKLFQS